MTSHDRDRDEPRYRYRLIERAVDWPEWLVVGQDYEGEPVRGKVTPAGRGPAVLLYRAGASGEVWVVPGSAVKG